MNNIYLSLRRNAIVADEFLRDLDASQIKDIVSVMFPMDYGKGSQFVKENELGNFVYVMESGKALVSRNEKVLFKIFSGKLFGEPQAMLYNSPRWVLSGFVITTFVLVISQYKKSSFFLAVHRQLNR